MEIEKKKTDLNPTMIAKKHFYPTKSLNTTKRVRDLKKVNTENKVKQNFNSWGTGMGKQTRSFPTQLFLGSSEETSVSPFNV